MSSSESNDGNPFSLSAELVCDWGSDSATSYICIDDADAYISAAVLDNSAWLQATPDRKKAALLEATRDVDSRQYLGSRSNHSQALEFPRQLDFDGSAIQIQMQRDVQQATCWQAVFLLRMNGGSEHSERIYLGLKEFRRRVGPVSEEYHYQTSSGNSLCPQALRILSRWLESTRVYRG